MRTLRLSLNSIFLLLAMTSAARAADVAPTKTQLANGCQWIRMCDGEADVTGACDDGGGRNYVTNIAGAFAGVVYSDSSTATTYTCNLCTSSSGYQATKRTCVTSASGNTNLSAADGRYSANYSGILVDAWVECDTLIAGGTVTVDLFICPLATK